MDEHRHFQVFIYVCMLLSIVFMEINILLSVYSTIAIVPQNSWQEAGDSSSPGTERVIIVLCLLIVHIND
jgi:hypothetical protein